jgi:hypothetical protein
MVVKKKKKEEEEEEPKEPRKQRTFFVESGEGSIRRKTTGRGTIISSGDKQIIAEPGENIQERTTGRGTRISVGTPGTGIGKFDVQEALPGGMFITRFGQSRPPPEGATNFRAVNVEGQPTTEEFIAAQPEAQGAQFLREQGFFEETRPNEVDLSPKGKMAVEKIPVVGPGIGTATRLLTDAVGSAMEKVFGTQFNFDQKQALIQDPETARELAQQAIQQSVINEGTSGSEKFGAFVEAIPVLGPLVGKYAGDLIETPSENVDTILAEVSKIGNRATNMREKALTGKMGDPYIAFQQLNVMQDDLAALEQRIKLLSIESAALQANGDKLNLIQETILDAKQRVFDAKQSAAAGVTATPSDSSLFLELEKLR